MNDHMIAAGLYALAKKHRRNAHDMRRRANMNIRANALASDAIKANARNAAVQVRAAADREELKAAFLKRGASLAKIGAVQMDDEAHFIEHKGREWSFQFPAFGRLFMAGVMSILQPKPKGTNE